MKENLKLLLMILGAFLFLIVVTPIVALVFTMIGLSFTDAMP